MEMFRAEHRSNGPLSSYPHFRKPLPAPKRAPAFHHLASVANTRQNILYMEDERPKKEAGHCVLRGGSFNKQRNLHRRFVLDGCKKKRCPNFPARVLKVYLEVLRGYSHIFSLKVKLWVIIINKCKYLY